MKYIVEEGSNVLKTSSVEQTQFSTQKLFPSVDIFIYFYLHKDIASQLAN